MFASLKEFPSLKKISAALAFFPALILPSAAHSQAAADSVAGGDSVTLENVDQKLRILERKLELRDEDDEKKKSENATVTAGKDGFSIKSADKEDALKFKFFQHTDGRYFFDDGANKLPNTLLLRRVRPVLEGTVSKYYNFRIMSEFAGTPSILDAYSEIAFWPEARLRVGKSKTPFGLERSQSSQDMEIIEFAHPTSLTPNYDLGISLLGDLHEESYSYYVGVFNGAVDGTTRDLDFNDDKDILGRVFALPFKTGDIELVRNFGIGFAASWGHKEGDFTTPDVPTYKTEGQQTFFAYRAVAGDSGTVRAYGNGYRINPQGYWYYGPFGLLGEYVASTQEYGKGGVNQAPVKELTSRAWQATASYVVTGESPSFKGLKPRHPVSWTESGLGALELVGRVSNLKVDDDAFPTFADPTKSAHEATTWSAGFNWYLSRNLKWSADYAWTEFKGGAASGGDRPGEKVFFSRIQTAF